jgi:putative ABC transport system substrate-binding protein
MKNNYVFFLFIFVMVFPATVSAGEDFYRISVNQFVEHPALDAVWDGFREYMAENEVPVEYRVLNAGGDMNRAMEIAFETIGLSPDLILSIATPSSQACAMALRKLPEEKRMPLVFSAVTDPVAADLVKNLDRPGGCITGISDKTPVGAQLEIIRLCLPELESLGIIYNSAEANSKASAKAICREAGRKGIRVVEVTVAHPEDLQNAAQSLVERSDGVLIPTDNTVVSSIETVVGVCIGGRLPLFASDVSSAKRGAAIATGFDYHRHGRRAAAMARRILTTRIDPGDCPVQTQTDLQIHVNLKSAKRMGMSVPPEIIKRAERIYE